MAAYNTLARRRRLPTPGHESNTWRDTPCLPALSRAARYRARTSAGKRFFFLIDRDLYI